MISVCGGSTIIISNGIETVCYQRNLLNDVKHITHMKSVFAKIMEMYTKRKKRDIVKIMCVTLSLREAAHSGSGVLGMGREAAVSGSPIYPGQF